MNKGTTFSVTARDLVLEKNPRHYTEKEKSYEFTGKTFYKPQKTNIRSK